MQYDTFVIHLIIKKTKPWGKEETPTKTLKEKKAKA